MYDFIDKEDKCWIQIQKSNFKYKLTSKETRTNMKKFLTDNGWDCIVVKIDGNKTKLEHNDRINIYILIERDYRLVNSIEIFIIDKYIHQSSKFNLKEFDYTPILYHYKSVKKDKKKFDKKFLTELLIEYKITKVVLGEVDTIMNMTLKTMNTIKLCNRINSLKWNNKYHKYQSVNSNPNENFGVRYNNFEDENSNCCNVCFENTTTKLFCNHYTCLRCLEKFTNKQCAECRVKLNNIPKKDEVDKNNYDFSRYNIGGMILSHYLMSFDGTELNDNGFDFSKLNNRVESELGQFDYNTKTFMVKNKYMTFKKNE